MTTAENPHAGQGMVVLDIGDDIGAVVISAPAALAGAEIEICPAGRRGSDPDEGLGWWDGEWRGHSHASHGHEHDHDHPHEHGSAGHEHEHPAGPDHAHASDAAWPHVAVIARPLGTGHEYSAVYPGLREGTYDLWVRPDGVTALTVAVIGGQVTAATWPTQT